MSDEEKIVYNTAEDQEWADLLSPLRRRLIVNAGLTAAGVMSADILAAGQEVITPDGQSFKPIVPPPDVGKSPWGYETARESTPRPLSLRPGEENGLPKKPRPYTDIKSYHPHWFVNGRRSVFPWNWGIGTWNRAAHT
jgi:DOPA 4,5-dioxygenase